MAASIIPERTMDQWISIVVAGVDPCARIWAPTPRAQAGAEPWDHAIDGSGSQSKLIVLESKGLQDDSAVHARNPHVVINIQQLLLLVYLQLWEGLPAYYALPGLRVADFAAGQGAPMWHAKMRLAPRQAGEWIRVPSALEVALDRDVLPAIRKQQASRRLLSSIVASRSWPDLVEFLARVRRCESGRLVSEAAPFGPLRTPVLASGAAMRAATARARDVLLTGHDGGAEATAELARAFAPLRTERPEPSLDTVLHRMMWIELSMRDTPPSA